MMPFFVLRDKLRYFQKLLANAHCFEFTDGEARNFSGGVMAGKSKGNASYSGDSAGVWERFGARVRQVRTQADVDPDDLTLREVCEPTTLAAIESGEYDPP
ncbi:hypothetical protein ACFW4K_19705 [Nocardiopsis alba]|uniref:hypothetical protein n=1 Tax=Nocardiopsis alba TaxID=53437 RepID=UPI00367286A4